MRGMEPLVGASGAQMVPQDDMPTGAPTSELPVQRGLVMVMALQSAVTSTMYVNNNIIQLDLESPLREVLHHITRIVADINVGAWKCQGR